MDMQIAVEQLLRNVEKPARYSGGELNAVIKDPSDVDVRFCMSFPDTYEVGMSHLGSKIIYSLANERADTYCERCFAPWVDMEGEMRASDVPLFSIETRTPLLKFDIIGFTLQFEMSYTNILNMLDLAKLPLRSADRKNEMPFIACGGPCACNPEPIAPFVDFFIIGDGEETIGEMLDCFVRWKKSGAPRASFLKEIAKLEGFYVPQYYHPQYNDDGTFDKMLVEDCAPAKVVRRIVKDLDKAYYPIKIIVPYLSIVHDRMMLELFRGCTRGCRFCQAGFLYRPVRERSKQTLLYQARELLKNTGYEEISLSSLSSGDYSCLGELVPELMQEFKDKRVSVSLPSLRIDSFVKDLAEELQSVRKSGLTFAPEAGTQRLRDVINKGVTQEDLVSSVSDAFSSGWNSVKLYFMIGLPSETNEDLDGIVELAKIVGDEYYRVPKQNRQKGLRIGVSVSTFVPKPWTPFQWEPQDTIAEIERKQRYLRDKFKGVRGVEYNYHSPKLSSLEAVFARGDRRLADVIEKAWELGCRFDSWSDCFKYDAWLSAFEQCGIDPSFYSYRHRGKDERWPYAHIDMRINEKYLRCEYERALEGATTRDCRKGCNGCFDGEDYANYCRV